MTVDTNKYLDFVTEVTSLPSTDLAALLSRITELDKRIDKVELRVASEYVTKTELSTMMQRMEEHLIRIEEKMDKITFNCK